MLFGEKRTIRIRRRSQGPSKCVDILLSLEADKTLTSNYIDLEMTLATEQVLVN